MAWSRKGGTKQEPSVPDDTVRRLIEIISASNNKLLPKLVLHTLLMFGSALGLRACNRRSAR